MGFTGERALTGTEGLRELEGEIGPYGLLTL